MPDERKQPKAAPAFALLAAMVGLGTASALITDTRADEGVRTVAYRDIGGVWTVCSGSTSSVIAGETDTAEQCDARTAADLTKAARIVLACAPSLKATERHNQLRAAIRFTNNTGRFCSGSPGRLMRAGRYRAGCDAMLRYVYVNGRVIPGLRNRRAREHAICVSGL
jgi:lysozyme